MVMQNLSVHHENFSMPVVPKRLARTISIQGTSTAEMILMWFYFMINKIQAPATLQNHRLIFSTRRYIIPYAPAPYHTL